jgi:hypothetical protein
MLPTPHRAPSAVGDVDNGSEPPIIDGDVFELADLTPDRLDQRVS